MRFQKISRLELKVVEEVFLTIAKVYEETKTREEFTAVFGKLLLDCVRIVSLNFLDRIWKNSKNDLLTLNID